MNKQVRQRLNILIILLVVLGLTLVLGYRMNRPVSTSAVQTPESKPVTSAPVPTDARIRLDLVDKPDGAQDIGRNNVFQYRQGRPSPDITKPGSTPITPAPPIITASPPPARPPGPAAPPPPPPIPLKYQGFAVVNSNTGTFTAFLTDDSSRHYNVLVGEVLLGRYRVTRISDTAVEVEDLEYNRRQTLPLLK